MKRITTVCIAVTAAGMPVHAGPVDMFGGEDGGVVIIVQPSEPYLSEADNPFDLSGLGETMFLENFEAYTPESSPGLFMQGIGLELRGPGPETDSVDGDDGIINGWGKEGHSLYSDGGNVTLNFLDEAIGFAPTQVGFAMTDGLYNFTTVELYDVEGNLLASPGYVTLGVEPNDGTHDDRFRGFMYDGGFSRITIRQDITEGFEIDHITYGIPEPATLALLVPCTLVMILHRRKHS